MPRKRNQSMCPKLPFPNDFESLSARILSAADFRPQDLDKAIDLHGVEFVQHILTELQRREVNVESRHFAKLVDHLFGRFADNPDATKKIDELVAEIEMAARARKASLEEVFRDEELIVKQRLLSELRSLRAELAKVAENGK